MKNASTNRSPFANFDSNGANPLMSDRDDEHLVASIEEDPIAQSLNSRTTFIPLRHNDLRPDLIERLSLSIQQEHQFTALCDKLQRIFHSEHLSQLLLLEEIYSPLDPDSQVVELEDSDSERRDLLTDQLFDRVSGLLFSAHYKKLQRSDLERAVEMASHWGVRLEVNFDLYQRLEIFARGYRVTTIERRRWRNFFRLETIELPEFQRLIMAFRLNESAVRAPTRIENDSTQKQSRRKQITNRISKLLAGDDADAMDANHVYLKTFKNIPETDIEILLPGSKVRLSMLDRGKILLPTAMALYKFSRLAVVLAAVFVAATYDNLLALMILSGAIIGYFMKSVLSYFRTKAQYQFGLTKSLYLKNLGNNSGVLYRILNEAEEQELLETILGYAILWQEGERVRKAGEEFLGLTSTEMDTKVEQYLTELTQIDIDFEIFDSLGKLARLGLADVDQQGRWTAVPLSNADGLLDASWSRLFQVRGMSVKFGSEQKADEKTTQSDDLFTS
jgi:hypothetical protein